MSASKALKFLTLPDIYRQKHFTKRGYEKLRETGYLGAVKGPHIAYHGRYPRVSEQQIDVYLLRKQSWNCNFLNGKQTAIYMEMPDTNSDTRANHYTGHCMKRQGEYMSVVAPLPYRFKDTTDVYWHVKDLELFAQFVRQVGRGLIDQSSPTYNRLRGVWVPAYDMPFDETYAERYTEGTLRLIKHRADLEEGELFLLRNYRKGVSPKATDG